MESINKYKKLFIALILIIGILILGTKSQAYAHKFSPSSSTNVKDGHFEPYSADGTGDWYYCIKRHWKYQVSIPLPTGYNQNEIHNTYCLACGEDKTEPPTSWNEGYSMDYAWDSTIDERYYQDAAYVMAKAFEQGNDENGLGNMETQWSLWWTALNMGGHHTSVNGEVVEYDSHGTWGDNAKNYKDFYNKIHIGTTDIYNTTISDNTNINNIKVKVDQKNKEYIVGPFNINYKQEGIDKEYWSYIKNIAVLKADGDKNTPDSEIGHTDR